MLFTDAAREKQKSYSEVASEFDVVPLILLLLDSGKDVKQPIPAAYCQKSQGLTSALVVLDPRFPKHFQGIQICLFLEYIH